MCHAAANQVSDWLAQGQAQTQSSLPRAGGVAAATAVTDEQEEKKREKGCEDDHDRDMAECRSYSKMTGDKYTFVACKKVAERRLAECMSGK